MGIEGGDKKREINVDECNQMRTLLEENSKLRSKTVKEKLKRVGAEGGAKQIKEELLAMKVKVLGKCIGWVIPCLAFVLLVIAILVVM